jgi:hypothetical protein
MSFGALFLLFGTLVHSDTQSALIYYPSGTPTFNYIDEITFEWVSDWDDTQIFIECDPSNGYVLIVTDYSSMQKWLALLP